MKKAVFEVWGEMMAEPENADYTRRDFINEAMEWTGWDVREDYKEKRQMIEEWYDEFRGT